MVPLPTSLTPIDLNEDQKHELSTPNQYHSSSSSFSSASLSYPILLHVPDQDQDQQISYYSSEEPKPLQNIEEAEKIIPSRGSWDGSAAEYQESSCSKRKLKVWKKERDENLQLQAGVESEIEGGGSSMKWMSSKMRIIRKMTVSDHHEFEEDHQKQPLSPLGTDTSSSNNNNNYSNSNHTIRVCSDCHTTKTPLWRSGPRGPKSLCNACGIRQRKATRRAMAAAAAANGTTVVAAEITVKKNKLQQKKENKSKIEFSSSTRMNMNKNKRKLGVGAKPISDDHSQSRKKLRFEDLRLSCLSKNLSFQHVFPQDEKEAAILLMALSYGLVHG